MADGSKLERLLAFGGLDAQARALDRVEMRASCNQHDVLPVKRQLSPNTAADAARTVDDVSHGGIVEVASELRVNGIQTAQPRLECRAKRTRASRFGARK